MSEYTTEKAICEGLLTCVLTCLENEEMVREYNRLSGTAIGIDERLPIERLIDEAAGYYSPEQVRELGGFIEFVFHTVYLPLMNQAMEEEKSA